MTFTINTGCTCLELKQAFLTDKMRHIQGEGWKTDSSALTPVLVSFFIAKKTPQRHHTDDADHKWIFFVILFSGGWGVGVIFLHCLLTFK